MSDQARRRFKAFHGRDPIGREVAKVRAKSVDVLCVGSLDGIIYTSINGGQQYIHRIKKNSRPALYVTGDGSQMFIVGGTVKFTERGFVDKPPKRRSR